MFVFTVMDLQVCTSFCDSSDSILVASNRLWPELSVGLHSAGSF